MRCSSPSGPMRLMPWVRAWATRCAASWASTASNSVPGEPWGCGSWVVVSVMWCLLRCAIGTLCHGVTPLYLQSRQGTGLRNLRTAVGAEIDLGWGGSAAVAAASGGADLGVGDVVREECVELGGLGGGVAEAAADDFDGDAGVDELGGVGVAELVDVDLDSGCFAVALPAVVGGIVGQRSAVAVDAGAEGGAKPVAGAGEVELEEGDVAAVVEEDGANGASLAVDADVFVVLAEVEVFEVEAADFGGAGSADVDRLEQDPVAEPVEGHVLARPSAADLTQDPGDVVGRGGPGQGLGHLDGVDLVHGVGVEAVLTDGPPAERGDGGAFALAGRGRQFADVGEECADGVGGEACEFAVPVGGELEEVAAVGADGVSGGVGVLLVGEEVVQVAGEGVVAAALFDDHRIHVAAPFAKLPDNRESNGPRRGGG